MVEFAIIVTLLFLLVAGGIELSLAALHSQRIGAAANSAATAWTAAAFGNLRIPSAGPWANQAILDTDADGVPDLGLGDHSEANLAAFANPACLASGGYDDGLPADATTQGGDRIYLYNPLPVDITDCIGGTDDMCTAGDPTDDSPRLRVLVDGYPADGAAGCAAADYAGLPAANQTLYGQYFKDCYDSGGLGIDCAAANPANGDTVYLRLPGNLASDNPATDVVELVAYDESGLPNPADVRPTFRLQCESPDGTTVPFPPGPTDADNCVEACYSVTDTDGDAIVGYADIDEARACNVRVVLRYRHVFESFLQMMDWATPADPAALAELDTVSVDGGGNSTQGSIGKEVNPRGDILKPQRTFVGCTESLATYDAGMTTLLAVRENVCR